jgi:hypothetical protein
VNWVRVIGAGGLETVVDDAASIRLYDITEDTIHDDTLTTLGELRRRRPGAPRGGGVPDSRRQILHARP